MKCEYCEKELKDKYTLKTHQKTSKYCLEKQCKELETNFKCENCHEIFTTNSALKIHILHCKIKIKNELKEKYDKLERDYKDKYNKLEKEYIDKYNNIVFEKEQLANIHKQSNKTISNLNEKILDLENKIFSLAEKGINKPTTITNNNNTITNYIDKMQNITSELLEEQSYNLTIDHIKNGAKGYSEYFANFPLKDNVKCTDYARRKIIYKDENGEVINDPFLMKISKNLFKSIRQRNRELSKKYVDELYEIIKKEPGNGDYFMNLIKDIIYQETEFSRLGEGDIESELFHDIVRYICAKIS
jgi:hypothetical protein